MAPEEQRTTRWPSWRRATAVSTIVDSVDSSGSWVVSSTIEDVPVERSVSARALCADSNGLQEDTQFDNDGEMFLHLVR